MNLYFIVAEEVNRVKIGYAKSVFARLNTLKTGSPVELCIFGSVKLRDEVEAQLEERKLHKKFKRFRLRREWFNFTPEMKKGVLDYIEHIQTRELPKESFEKEWVEKDFVSIPTVKEKYKREIQEKQDQECLRLRKEKLEIRNAWLKNNKGWEREKKEFSESYDSSGQSMFNYCPRD